MKKTIKILAVVMIIAMLSVVIVGCSKKLSGKWVSDPSGLGEVASSKTVYEFSGKKVTMTVTSTFMGKDSTETLEGTYEIMEDNDNPDKLVIAFEFEGKDRYTVSFSEGKNADGDKIITIGGVDFKQSK